jgi:mannitol-specific phosphotransferase system IIBC component
MKMPILKTSSLLAVVSIFGAGCADLTPLQNAGVFGAASGAAAGGIASAAGANAGQAVAIGAATGAVVAAVTYVIAKHQATERQRRIAEERAQRAYAQRKSQLQARKTRYIAVDTEKNDQTSPEAKKSVMIWDTQSQEVVGNNVYDVKSPPPVGSTAKFDTYSAEYVGSGS